MSEDHTRTRTPLLEFQALRAFRFRQHNTGPRAEQAGEMGERYYTSSESFANQVVLRDQATFKLIKPRVALPCLPRAAWASTSFAGRSVLFLLPGEALGENAAMLLFLSAFIRQARPKEVGVFCARSCSDIYLREPRLRVFPLMIGRREFKRWQVLIDLGQLESRRSIDTWPVDMESELLAAFGNLPADAERFPSAARPLPAGRRLRIGLFPIASSPLRTLPAPVGLALAEELASHGDLSLVLNTDQRQGQLFAAALAGRLPAGVRRVERFEGIGELIAALADLDYAVFADSGPAHLSKLTATAGTCIYSSAPGAVLQGRFENLANFSIDFTGPHCRAPCGLAKIRKTADGRVGCMGSLGLSLAELPHTAGRGDAGEIERLQRQPVPCLQSLADDPRALVAFVRADLQQRARLDRL